MYSQNLYMFSQHDITVTSFILCTVFDLNSDFGSPGDNAIEAAKHRNLLSQKTYC